ncbi:hypothetical protein [Tessaracoccus sp. Z1128]
MIAQSTESAPSAAADVPESRSRFTTLLAVNPNYFGKVVDGPFDVVDEQKSNTVYEEIGCLGYHPERNRLEATIVIKRAFGYSGGPCTPGSTQYVRFFVLESGSWVDAGLSATQVHDISIGKDCTGDPDHAFSHVVGVTYAPRRRFCFTPQLPRVRAILSWQQVPPAGDPDFVPVWGEVQEDTIQVRPRPLVRWPELVELHPDLLDKVKDLNLLEELIPDLDFDLFGPVPPLPDPIGPVSLNPQPLPPNHAGAALDAVQLAKVYSKERLRKLSKDAVDNSVAKLVLQPPPPSRLAALEAAQVMSASLTASELSSLSIKLKDVGIAWQDLFEDNEGLGNTSYEELTCVGLDNNAAELVAAFRVKLPTGFSGAPCTAGSTEYVAFWADWDDDCTWEYVGTVEINAHDFVTMPAGGLGYAATLPVDLNKVRRHCDKPGIHKVRAVLSWNAAPSTTDPNWTPHWGNRLDAHVHVHPGAGYDGTARMTIVGGVNTSFINPSTGVTIPGAVSAYNGIAADVRGCPFGGRVVVHGPTDPALAGTTYRLQVSKNGGLFEPVTTSFWASDNLGGGAWVTPAADGSVQWPVWWTNGLGVLGYVDTGGEGSWLIRLEVGSPFLVAQTQRIRLDNTGLGRDGNLVNGAHVAVNPGQLGLQACGKFTQGMVIKGTFDANDEWLDRWSLGLTPGGSVVVPPGALTTSTTLTTVGAPGGSTWKLDTSALEPCGYVLRISTHDRAIVNSVVGSGHYAYDDLGFCIDKA